MKKKILLVALTGLICFTVCGAKSKELTLDTIPYDWSEEPLALEIPFPDAKETVVNETYNDEISIDVFGTSDDYKEYIEQCIDAGFDIDITDNGENIFGAFRKDGALIKIYYFEEDEEKPYYAIILRESWIKDDLDWPVTDLSLKLPRPEGTKGKSLGYNKDYFSIHVGEMPEEKVLKYIEELKEAGFSKDAVLLDGDFTAKYEEDENLELTLRYGGVDEMTITLQNKSN